MNVKGKRIMVVAAHADDADYYCGGTIGLWASQGAEITYLICTDNSLGSSDPKMTREKVSDIRLEEQKAANSVLGVKETIYLGYPDMSLKTGETLRKKIAAIYRKYRPNIVLTFDPWRHYELHPDHIAAGIEAVYARLAAENTLRYPDLNAKKLMPWSISEIFLFKTDNPNTWIDIEDILKLKADTLACHKSQFADLLGDEKQAVFMLREMSQKNPQTGRISEGLRRIPFEGLEGLKTYIGI